MEKHSNEGSSSSKRLKTTILPSVLNYFKTHYTQSTFRSEEFLKLLNCNTPESAKEEAKQQLDRVLEVKNLNRDVKKFVSCLLIDGLACLSDSNAKLYWEEKKSVNALLTSSHKQFQFYHETSSAITDQAMGSKQPEQPEQVSSPASSNSLSRSSSLVVENIWSIWSEFLDLFLSSQFEEADINRFSLEYLGIVTLGCHVGNKQTRGLYPKELVVKSNDILNIPEIDVFLKFASFYPPIFQSLSESVDDFHTLLLKNSLKVKNSVSSELQFTFDFLMIFATQVLKHCHLISKLETTYNYRVIYRFFDAVVDVIPACTFSPGEVRLKSIAKELERLNMSRNSYYNADGVVTDDVYDLEICLLETSGPFGSVNITKETTDQVKAAYGLLAMLHTIAHQFIHADFYVLQKLKVCFIHPAQDRIRLWSFSIKTKHVYVLNRESSAILPTSVSDKFENESKCITNLFWRLKMLIDDAKSIFKELEASHQKNKREYDNGTLDILPRLDHYLIESAEVKLSSCVSEASDLFISSSPIYPDSP